MKLRNTSSRNNVSSGFTLIEILIVIAILAFLFALGLFATMDTYRGYSNRSERDLIVSLLTKARSRAMNNIFQSSHGLCYASVDKKYNLLCTSSNCKVSVTEEISVSPSATVSGIPICGAGAILFDQLTGRASGIGPITINEPGRPTETIIINNEGTIIW